MKLGSSVAFCPHCFSVYPFTNFSYIVFPTKLIACSSKFFGSVIPASFFSCSIFSFASFGVTTPHNLLNVFMLNGMLYSSSLYLATGEFVYLLNSANWFIYSHTSLLLVWNMCAPYLCTLIPSLFSV